MSAKLVEVTEAGTPLICAFAAGASARQINAPAIRASALPWLSSAASHTNDTLDWKPWRRPPELMPLHLIRASRSSVGLSIFCQFEGVVSG